MLGVFFSNIVYSSFLCDPSGITAVLLLLSLLRKAFVNKMLIIPELDASCGSTLVGRFQLKYQTLYSSNLS